MPIAQHGTLVVVTETAQVGGTRGFLPAVEGMRACAAIGVVVTHVAFQTGHTGGITGRLFGRFDLAVAVFFALSGFLLWRGHAAAARGLRPVPPTGHYLRSRIVRIMPAYLVAVVVILTLLPDAKADLTVWLANLSLTQIYVPLTLTAGLTQMWSLSVEVSFYLALPMLALLVRRLPVRARIPVIAAVAVASFGWALHPVQRAVRRQPAELAAGVLLVVRRGHAAGRVDSDRIGWPHRLARRRLLMAVIAVAAFLVAASPLAGPEGLTPGTVSQFVVKTAMGAVLAAALIAPLVLDRPDTPHRILGNTTMVTLGRWSYGLFIWHLAALAMVFPIIGEFAFNGHMPVVLVLTRGVRLRDRSGQLRAGRVAVPGCVAALGDRRQRSCRHLDSAVTTRLSLPSRDDLVAHRRPACLARVVAQRGVDELDRARHLVACDAVGEECRDGRLVEPVGLHDGVRHLTQVVVGHANHQAGQHIRMLGQRGLDLGGVDVAAADGEHVDPPVVEIEEAVGVEVAEVAERIPAVAALRGRPDVAVGRRAARRWPHVDLAADAGRALVAVVVEHLHLAGDDDARPSRGGSATDRREMKVSA